MKESIGYSATLRIAIMFIIVIFFFLGAIVIYYKGNKVNKYIIHSIEKYEGYNSLSKKEISNLLTAIGYNKSKITCESDSSCTLVSNSKKGNNEGYCVYKCTLSDNKYYYKVKTNLLFYVPLINNILNLPIYASTDELTNMEEVLK